MNAVAIPSSRLLLAWIILVIAVGMLVLAPQVAHLPGLDRTIHAQNQHAEQVWNAEKIIAAMSSGQCGPVDVYECPDGTYVYTCTNPGNPSQLLGLVVGITTQNVITGYTARSSYWEKNVGGCTYLGPGAMP